MRKWSRWADWTVLVVGAYAFLSPIWTSTTSTATWTVVVLGVVTALVALWSLAAPGTVASEGLVAVLGVLFFISPWVMGFTATTAMEWTAWVVGVVTFVYGVSSIPESRQAHRARLVTQH